MLDELVAFLRAAIPHVRDTSSTVGREAELARAYLSLMGMSLDPPLSFSVEVPDEASQIRFPPMLVLPLVARVLSCSVRRSADERSIRIRASLDDARVEFRVTGTIHADDPWRNDLRIDVLREQLHCLYADHARMDAGVSPTRAIEISIQVPVGVRTDFNSANAMESAVPGSSDRMRDSESRAAYNRAGC